MTRVVLDVNVLVSGFPSEQGTPSDLVAAWSDGDFELVLSEHILRGMTRAWSKPYYQTRYRDDQVVQTLKLLRAHAIMVTPVETVHDVGEDEEDDLVLATAIAGQASYLVTGDKVLRSVGTYQNVIILTPREYLALLLE